MISQIENRGLRFVMIGIALPLVLPFYCALGLLHGVRLLWDDVTEAWEYPNV